MTDEVEDTVPGAKDEVVRKPKRPAPGRYLDREQRVTHQNRMLRRAGQVKEDKRDERD